MAVSMLAAAASQATALEAENLKAIAVPPRPRTDSNYSSISSSPRHFPTDLTNSILEEGDETESEPTNEPVTPVSGRQSQDFGALTNHEIHADIRAAHDSLSVEPHPATFSAVGPDSVPDTKPHLLLNTAAPPSTTPARKSSTPSKPTSIAATPTPATPSAEQEPPQIPLSRRSTRGSSSRDFKRTMSNFFKRTNSAVDNKVVAGYDSGASETTFEDGRKAPTRRWSMNKSSATTRSNSPPSPGSPLEIAIKSKEDASTPTVPSTDAFYEKKKVRASTGLSLRSRAVNFIGNGGEPRPSRPHRRRANSFEYSKGDAKPVPEDPNNLVPVERAFWGLPAETGTGVKARRMSLSLPDDFHVDVVELQSEFEYMHKLLGRHGKHLGKGATSKVTLMVRKGSPGELYAVKEFRGKSSSETKEEYEKKIKSEFTVAKSLHHPNIVETIRLCTDHGRWNHVMEYCSEGDLYSLVNRKYLNKDDREKDRLCLFKQLIQGINYLHANGIAHRDIKLENLLVTSDSKLKITDFGVSEVFCGTHPGLRESGGVCGRNMGEVRRCAPGICGSEPYIAPEVLKKNGDYDPRGLDVWSSAIVMLNLIFGAPLWARADASKPKVHVNYADLVRGWEKWEAKHADDKPEDKVITESDYPRVKAFDACVKPPALRRILLQMLNPDPEKRISVSDVINNRWVKQIECCQLESYDDPAKTIDASKKTCLNRGNTRKVFCHNHLPMKEHNSHSLGKMPGSAGY
ncbi:Protein kinase-like domain containing protein [Naviculisporaceae sp. PSN 640]